MAGYPDDDFFIIDPVDRTKVARFDSGTVASGTLRVFTLPNENGILALQDGSNAFVGPNIFDTDAGGFTVAGAGGALVEFADTSALQSVLLTIPVPLRGTRTVTLPDADCRLVGALFTQTADKSVTNTTTETTIFGTGVGSLTLTANTLTAGRTLRLTMSGVYSTVAVTGDIITVKVKLGSTVIATKATTALVTGGTGLYWESEVLITCRTTGASGTVMTSGGISYQIAGAVTVTDELNNAAATTTVDTTASKVIDVTVTHSAANASNTVKSLVSAVEILN